jgi:hypothetical protein
VPYIGQRVFLTQQQRAADLRGGDGRRIHGWRPLTRSLASLARLRLPVQLEAKYPLARHPVRFQALEIGMCPHSRGANTPGLCTNLVPPITEGAGNAGRPMRPIAARAMVERKMQTRCQVTPEIARHSPRNGFNGFLRALLGDRACLPPSFADSSAHLTPASGRQDHTTSPSASGALVFGTVNVHRIPHPTSVTTAKRPSCGTGWREL